MRRAWVAIAILILVVVAFASRRSSLRSGPAVGGPAPEIVGEDIDGRPMALAEFRGKVVLLDFWGHW